MKAPVISNNIAHTECGKYIELLKSLKQKTTLKPRHKIRSAKVENEIQLAEHYEGKK